MKRKVQRHKPPFSDAVMEKYFMDIPESHVLHNTSFDPGTIESRTKFYGGMVSKFADWYCKKRWPKGSVKKGEPPMAARKVLVEYMIRLLPPALFFEFAYKNSTLPGAEKAKPIVALGLARDYDPRRYHVAEALLDIVPPAPDHPDADALKKKLEEIGRPRRVFLQEEDPAPH